MDCPYCLVRDPEQEVVFESDLVRFLQDRRYQGALRPLPAAGNTQQQAASMPSWLGIKCFLSAQIDLLEVAHQSGQPQLPSLDGDDLIPSLESGFNVRCAMVPLIPRAPPAVAYRD
jgi:hypothetical protein